MMSTRRKTVNKMTITALLSKYYLVVAVSKFTAPKLHSISERCAEVASPLHFHSSTLLPHCHKHCWFPFADLLCNTRCIWFILDIDIFRWPWWTTVIKKSLVGQDRKSHLANIANYTVHKISSFINAICVGNVTPAKKPTTRCIFSANVKGLFLATHNPVTRSQGQFCRTPISPTSLGKICSLQGE